jgi:PAS domain S-box-containing protein
LQKRQDLDVILMDVQMPEMDGFETAARIKKMPGCADIPVIFVTAVYREDPYVKKGYAMGGIDYLSKPFDPEILRTKVSIDASHRQKADLLRERERHIRESEELLRLGHKLAAVLETLPVGVLIADIEGRICQTSEEAARILKSVGQTQDNSYGERLGWWDSAGLMVKNHPLTRALAAQGAEVSHGEPLEVRCNDGSMKSILASKSPLHGFDGDTIGAAILIRDITESRKIEEDLADRVTRFVALGVDVKKNFTR